MSLVWGIVAMGIGVFTLRIAGMLLCHLAIPPAWERALRFVPTALLSALMVSSFSAQHDRGVIPLVAIVAAGWVAHLTGRMWACIVSGMMLYWLLRYLWGQG